MDDCLEELEYVDGTDWKGSEMQKNLVLICQYTTHPCCSGDKSMSDSPKNSSNHEEVGVWGESDAEESGKEEWADQPAHPLSAQQLAKHTSQEAHWNRGKYIETR